MARKSPTPGKPAPERATTADPRVEELALELARSLEILTSELRLRAVIHLARVGETSVHDLSAAMCTLPTTLSAQLTRMRLSGVVRTRREGNYILYSVRPEYFGDLLRVALSADGTIPAEVRLGAFTLSYQRG